MSNDLRLSDLHNPRKVTSILHSKAGYIVLNPKNQGFQEWPGSWELWQKMEDGRLMRVVRCLKKCVIATYTDNIEEDEIEGKEL